MNRIMTHTEVMSGSTVYMKRNFSYCVTGVSPVQGVDITEGVRESKTK